MMDYYAFHVSFAVVRLILWFIILFVWITPFLFEELSTLSRLEKLIYSWLGLGGIILIAIASLAILHVYDFFSIALTIILIPLIRALWNHREEGVFVYLERYEVKTVITQIRFIEGFKGIKKIFSGKEVKFGGRQKASFFKLSVWTVFIVISASFVLRIVPALEHAEPFSRGWFFNLHHIKEIRLQDYFDNSASPAGLFAFISLFSMLTQVSPELILHIFGACNTILLLIILYWSYKKILGDDNFSWAALFGIIIYGIVPALFLPVDLNHQIEANQMLFSLCFAIPTIVLFMMERKAENGDKMFFISMGIIATGLTNLFVLLILVVPLLIISYLSRLKKYDVKKNIKDLIRIIISIALLAVPYGLYIIRNGIDISDFIQEQLFATNVSSNISHLLFPINILSTYYIYAAVIVIIIYSINSFINKNRNNYKLITILICFIIVSLLYLPSLNIGYYYIDIDQFNSIYSVFVSVFFVVIFYSISALVGKAVYGKKSFYSMICGILCLGFILGVKYLRGTVSFYQPESKTFPSSFFQVYYKIINNNVPNTYTVVGPDIDSTMALNRHDYMDYDYFFHDYTARDSVFYEKYYPYPKLRKKHNDLSNLFVFVEKKPYNQIQVGIMPDQKEIMKNMYKWIDEYKKKKYRTIKLKYTSSNIDVYEIINNPHTSNIFNVLFKYTGK